MASYAAEIARLRKLINTATRSTSTDGVSTSFDLEFAKRRLRELEQQDEDTTANRRPTILGVNLGGCF